MVYNFLLCSASRHITQRELDEMRAPLELNARHCADAHGLTPPVVEIIDDLNKLRSRNTRTRNWVPVLFLDSDSEEDPTTLAVHYADPITMLPAARVLVDRASGFHTGSYSVFESAAHEILEANGNPYLNIWRPHPNPLRKQDVPNELCDMVQNTYPIAHHNTTWPAANFVTPAWFDSDLYSDPDLRKRFVASGQGFDHLRSLHMPGEVGPEGYVILRDRVTGVITSEARLVGANWIPRHATELAAKRHPWSRSRRLGLQL